MNLTIVAGGLDHPAVRELLEHHVVTARSVTPVGSAHALNLDGLRTPDIQFWSVWDDDDLLGVGALRALTATHGEIKSMHTAARARRRGIGRLMVEHIVAVARAMGMTRLSLETGAFEYFVPARELYASLGFAECGPYAHYKEDPNSVFMTLEL